MTVHLKKGSKKTPHIVSKKSSGERKAVIEKGAKDFAIRFEKVMKELAKG